MINETIIEVESFFEWYKAVYGDEIRNEQNLDFPSELIIDEPIIVKENVQTIEVQEEKLSGKMDENEHLIHQGDGKLKSFYHEINQCQKCSLHTSRINFVFGMGNPHANVMFIGEAPGREEDLNGLPFVGKAGQLLDKMLFALKMKREDVYIANVLKCRPTNNRDPLPEEILHCEPFLKKQIEIIKPKVIVALGRISAQVLLKNSESLSNLRQSIHQYEKIPFIVTYHPAALLRNPGWKGKAWQDLKNINAYLS